jgi:hypothetical protein
MKGTSCVTIMCCDYGAFHVYIVLLGLFGHSFRECEKIFHIYREKEVEMSLLQPF